MTKEIETVKLETKAREIPEYIKKRNIKRFYSYYLTGFMCACFGCLSIILFYCNQYSFGTIFLILFMLGLPFVRIKK